MKVPKQLVPADHAALHQAAQPVDPKDLKLLGALADGLDQVLKRHQTGIGLALPQLGVALRGFMLHGKIFSPCRHRYCFNPEILNAVGEAVSDSEGCLSLPGQNHDVARPLNISVRYVNHQGRSVTESLDGLAARAFQHELDHLNGVLICDPRN